MDCTRMCSEGGGKSRQRSLALTSNLTIFIFLVLNFAKLGQSSPLFDVYRVEREPDAIPMQYLSDPLEVDFPGNQIIDDPNPGEIWTSIQKRARHAAPAATLPNTNLPNSCCPTVIDVIQPLHGKNRAGELVELYSSDTVRQRFYENSCAPMVADAPCRFLDRRYAAQSRCVQQYSYTYAMVRDMGSLQSGWKLDYIQVRSGCSCQISQ